MFPEERNRKFNLYNAKLCMLGENINKIGIKRCDDEIVINLAKYAEYKAQPKRLIIPDFATKIENEDFADIQARHIYFPDDVVITKHNYKALNDCKSLKSISITTKQFRLAYRDGYKCELRIPKEADMVHTEKIDKLFDYIKAKHTPKSTNVTGRGLFALFEIISKAASEEVSLAALSIYAIENQICRIEDLDSYIPEYISEVLKELFSSKITDWINKWEIIKYYSWLTEAYELKLSIENKYKIETDDFMLYKIKYEPLGLGNIDLKLKLNDKNFKIEDNVLEGFDGRNRLGYFKYYMSGETSVDTALDIIRLTSAKEQFFNTLDIESSYRRMFLKFFEQHWYCSHNLPVWCYPNGVIDAMGYDKYYTITDIITEACMLAAEFKDLNMNVTITPTQAEEENENILISIRHGCVNASITDKIRYSNSWDIWSDYIEKVKQQRKEGKMGLSGEEVAYIRVKNLFENQTSSPEKDRLERLKAIYPHGMRLAFELERYTEEKLGVHLGLHHSIYCADYSMLRYLFDFDIDKLEENIKNYNIQRGKEWE